MEKLFMEEILSRGLTPNEMYLLQCVLSGESPRLINKSLEIRKLQSKGYISKDFKLTDKLEVIKHLLKVNKISNEDFIAKYIELFPKIKLPSGKYARSHRTNIEASFKWFFKVYDYDWETILKATAYYIKEYEIKNYLYMKTSQYFIAKTNTDKSKESELANYCEMLKDGTLGRESNHFSERVV
jgi:hypothetical protein